MDGVHHHRLVQFRVEVDTADGQRADSLAVIALGQAHEFFALGMTGLIMVLESELQRDFDGGRPVVVEMELRQSLRHDARKLLGQPDRRLMGKVREDDLLQLVDLLLDGGVDIRVGMPQKIAPPGADDVEIFLSVDGVKPRPFAAFDDNGRQFLIVLHLGRRVPDMREVARLPCVRRGRF